MKISEQKITWISLGLVLSLFVGMPAIADDTELLLINPDPRDRPKPNVLFILDTSGSMDTIEETSNPYESTTTYMGPVGNSCDSDAVYWTDVDVTPSCADTNTAFVKKANFYCDYGARQLAGIGSFTNTMVQYRAGGKDGTSSSPTVRWQYLAAGYNTEAVECQADSGVHGDGRSTHLWATSGSNLADAFTNIESVELSWGSAPRNLSYTFYDGNYLNWKNSPETVPLSRINILKTVTRKVLSSVDNLNVGLMRFHDRDGGPVIQGITDLDENRDDVLAAVATLPASGRTPLSETMYEAALYWRGMEAHYGNIVAADHPYEIIATDPAAFASTGPNVYAQPEWDVCSKNYNVLLTDGAPNEDYDTPGLAPSLPLFSDTLGGRTECTGTDQGDCLDDITEYLSKVDIDTIADGDQHVVTHTIGFGSDVSFDNMKLAAAVSGGEYFLADDVETLTKTLLDILANINDRSLSFSAPAVSVNTFNRTQNLNDLYITMFGAKAKTHWPGNLKKYRIVGGDITDANGDLAVNPATGFFAETAQSFWTFGTDGNDVRLGGAAQELPDPTVRNLYTNNAVGDLTAGTNHVSTSNLGAFIISDFGLTGADGEPSMSNIINWARGADLLDEDNNSETTRRTTMGDPLHSQPAAIVYGGTPDDPEMVVYTATNDGYLHAIDADTGAELWSFIPKELLSNLTRLYFDPGSRYKQYGIDGNVVPVVKDDNKNGIIDGDDFVYIIFGMRRGGSTYYALDVTNKSSPKLLWDVTLTNAGESWSTPTVVRMDIDVTGFNDDKAVVIIGGGYDTVHDTTAHPAAADGSGAGIHVLDLASGVELWRAGPDDGATLTLDTMTRGLPTRVRAIDFNGNGFVDRLYASDLGGQIWRFDVFVDKTPAELITGGVIARLGAETIATPSADETRRFYNAPDISLFTDTRQQRRFIAMSIGSGYRAHPFDLSATDRFYSIRDPDVLNKLDQDAYDSYSVIVDSDLVEVSGSSQAIISTADSGWKFTLPDNQKVLANSLTFNDEIMFVAFSPDSSSAATCAAGKGTNYLYHMKVINGDPIVPLIETLADADADAARSTTLQQGGIAPSPTILFPSPDDPDCEGAACSPEPIRCVGVECAPPGFNNYPVRTLWTQDGIE
jgi:type IV pilus assembly protein PilY1